MRDVGSIVTPPVQTGLYEYHPDGVWTPIGSFQTIHLAEVARDLLHGGTHLVRLASSESCGDRMPRLPTGLIPYSSARERMVELGLVDDFKPAGGTAEPAP